MTTIDHQQAAIQAGAKALADDWNPDRDPVLTAMFSDYSATALTAATPHLRAAFLDELKRAQFEVEGRHHFGFGENGVQCLCGFASPRNRSRTEHITRAVLALLEGGAE